ncbi:MAG: hypothetical protein U1F98_12760 [Verrucomicrobiota bacterium]
MPIDGVNSSVFAVHHYWATFVQLIETPFQFTELIWGIVPLYFALLLGELTSAKANFRTAIQTGFSFLWAGVQWLYPYFRARGPQGPHLELDAMVPVKMLVTFGVMAMGVVALWSGLRKHFPKYGRFLGYTRFANYFMIMIFPMQTGHLAWTWERLLVVAGFAFPIWLVLHYGLMPVRK